MNRFEKVLTDVEDGVQDEDATEVETPDVSAVTEGHEFEEVAAAHDVRAR